MYIDEGRTDSEISKLFNIPVSKVGRVRRKHGITIRNIILEELLMGKTEESRKLNKEAKDRLIKEERVGVLSKSVAHFAFRNGPIEDMHAKGQLSKSDMMTLNKFVHNRLAYLVQLIVNERWLELELLMQSQSLFGTGWDKAEPDGGGNKEVIRMMLKKN